MQNEVESRRMSRGGRASELEEYRRNAMKAAEDFHYGKRVIQQIYEAKTSDEISRIMREARIKKFDIDDGVYCGPVVCYKSAGGTMSPVSVTKFK